MFRQAAAIIAVSREMVRRLVAMGAAPEKVHYNSCGVDCEEFSAGDPARAEPVLLAVGRFVDKKAPHLTLAAFAEARRACPDARLRMIGDGPLLADCRQLVRDLGVEEAVVFLGSQPHHVVQEEMKRARAFVQHSIEAPSGDCEGTPVAVLEAGASGLPVIATRHGGIPDVVIEGETGLLVDEQDVSGMAAHMTTLLKDPSLAGRQGQAGRRRIQELFSMDRSLGRLWAIIDTCIRDHRSGASR
jgi:glycosyltransferase involved in cell wall biosynthesis